MFFSTKTITVEIGCNKADRPKMLAEPPAGIVFDYKYMVWNITVGLLPLADSMLLNSAITQYWTQQWQCRDSVLWLSTGLHVELIELNTVTSVINYYFTICTIKLPPYLMSYFGDLLLLSASILAFPEATSSWQPPKMDGRAPWGKPIHFRVKPTATAKSLWFQSTGAKFSYYLKIWP